MELDAMTVIQLFQGGLGIYVFVLLVTNKLTTIAQSDKMMEHGKELAKLSAEIIGAKIMEGIEQAIERGIAEGLKSAEKSK